MMAKQGKTRTDPGSGGGTIALPVVQDRSSLAPMKRSRMGRRRAIVLFIVQFLIIVHVIIWILGREYGWFGGATVTPIEPSESMEFVKRGVINAGLVFFVLALLSTLALGRWFCGWGCHVVLLQDACLWMLRKVKIRPKPFRSRLLMWAPLILAFYMFIWPLVHRMLPFLPGADAHWELGLHLTTKDFWKPRSPACGWASSSCSSADSSPSISWEPRGSVPTAVPTVASLPRWIAGHRAASA